MTPEARAALERLGKDMARQRKDAEAQAALEKQRRAAAEREATLFRQAVQDAAPLRAPKRMERPTPRPIGRIRRTGPGEQGRPHGVAESVAPETPESRPPALSDGMDEGGGFASDDDICYLRAGFAPNTLSKLRRGDWPVQGQLDLHGQTRDAARDAVGRFLSASVQRGLRCIRIVHGKGLGSTNRTPVLRGRVPHWLKQSEHVLGFVQASPASGGAGAILVLLAGQHP